MEGKNEPQDKQRRARFITLGFVGFLAAYVATATALRGQFDVRYDDTTIAHSRFRGTWQRSVTRLSEKLTSPGYWKQLLLVGNEIAPPPGAHPYAYRPLESAYRTLAALLYFRFGMVSAYLLCFFALGVSGYLIFELFREVGSVQLAAICAAAYLFFPAVVSPAWISLAGPQSFVPAAYAAAMLAYLRYLRTQRMGLLVVLAAICLVGPTFKETIGCIGILLLTHYLVAVPGKRWGMVAGLALASAHGLFPSTAIRLLLTGQVSWISIFDCGALFDHASARSWRPEFLMDLDALVPPSLWLVSLASMLACACLTAPAVRLTLPERFVRRAVPLARRVLLLVAPAAIAAQAALIVERPIVGQPAAAALALTAIALYGLLYVDLLIAGWFCAMFLPLTRIYFNTTQCGYVAAPLIYLIAASLFHCGGLLAVRVKSVPWRRALRGAVAAVGLLAFCDNALSVPNSWLAYRQTQQFDDGLIPADLRQVLLQPDAQNRWIFIANSVVVDDAVILSTGLQFSRGMYNFGYGVPPARVLRTKEDIQKLLGDYNCVMVIADCPNRHQAYYWDLWDLQKLFRPVHEQDFGFTAYYADPLRRYVDNRYRSMMAPPDFHREYVKETRWFRERFTNHYRLFVREQRPADLAALTLTGTGAEQPGSAPPGAVATPSQPRLCAAGVQGFNIIQCGGKYFGLRQGDGAFVLEKALAHKYPACLEGTSVEHVKQLIGEWLATKASHSPAPAADDLSEPQLCETGVHRFNIIRCGDRYFGLRQGDGAFVLEKALAGEYPVCLQGTSVEHVKRLIDESIGTTASRGSSVIE